MQPEAQRLPCRGCTADCPNFDQCDGKPWLLRNQLRASLDWAGLPASEKSEVDADPSLAG